MVQRRAEAEVPKARLGVGVDSGISNRQDLVKVQEPGSRRTP